MPPLDIKHRVDALLKEGVDRPKKWVTVRGYVEPQGDPADFDWYNEWQRLREHHLGETNFLFDVIRELVDRHVEPCNRCTGHMKLVNGCWLCSACGNSRG